MGIDLELQAKKFLVPDKIGHRVVLLPAAEQFLELLNLVFVQEIGEVKIKPGPLPAQAVGQEHFGIEPRGIAAGGGEMMNGFL